MAAIEAATKSIRHYGISLVGLDPTNWTALKSKLQICLDMMREEGGYEMIRNFFAWWHVLCEIDVVLLGRKKNGLGKGIKCLLGLLPSCKTRPGWDGMWQSSFEKLTFDLTRIYPTKRALMFGICMQSHSHSCTVKSKANTDDCGGLRHWQPLQSGLYCIIQVLH